MSMGSRGARPECPPALEALILRLLEKDPTKRPASADEARPVRSIDLTYLSDLPRSDVASDSYRMAGECLIAQGQYDEATKAFESALALTPSDASTLAGTATNVEGQIEKGPVNAPLLDLCIFFFPLRLGSAIHL